MIFTAYFEVTLAENVLPTGDLKDETLWGLAVSEHIIPITNFNEETKQLETKVVQRIGVKWNHSRVPAVSYHDPNELFCLEIYPDEDEDDEGDDLEESQEAEL